MQVALTLTVRRWFGTHAVCSMSSAGDISMECLSCACNLFQSLSVSFRLFQSLIASLPAGYRPLGKQHYKAIITVSRFPFTSADWETLKSVLSAFTHLMCEAHTVSRMHRAEVKVREISRNVLETERMFRCLANRTFFSKNIPIGIISS